MKKVVVFGSTGSIGKNTLDIIRKDRENFKVVGLCASRDINTLYSQIKEFSPSYICVADEKRAEQLKKNIGKRIKLFKGNNGLLEFSQIRCDISVMAISGISCLKPLLINTKYAKRIALANKESMVVAGSFVKEQIERQRVEIIPVDSEINALFQLFENKKSDFSKVYITASGGSLINHKKKDLKKVGIKEVLSHPTWNMGKRITVDSATLVNKGFEVVEAHQFFDIPYEKINVVIHKESIIHALIEAKGGSLFACLYPTDMKIPISFAIYYPLLPNSFEAMKFRENLSLTFEPIDFKQFTLLKLVLDAASKNDNSLAILNACDEVAIDYFLKKKIKFIDIYKVMEYIFKHYPSHKLRRLEDIFYWDNWGRVKTKNYLERIC